MFIVQLIFLHSEASVESNFIKILQGLTSILEMLNMIQYSLINRFLYLFLTILIIKIAVSFLFLSLVILMLLHAFHIFSLLYLQNSSIFLISYYQYLLNSLLTYCIIVIILGLILYFRLQPHNIHLQEILIYDHFSKYYYFYINNQ